MGIESPRIEEPREGQIGGNVAGEESERRRRYRYCPLESGEPIDESACATCPHSPPAPFRICFTARPARPRRRGFWDREEAPQ